MKKTFAGIALVLFLVPSLSFAQTTVSATYSPQYIALLEQLLKVLEQELAAIQNASATSNTSSVTSQPASFTPTAAIQVSVAQRQPYISSGGMYYQFPLTIANGTASPIYVPIATALSQNSDTPSFAYTINGNTDGGSVSSTVNCSPMSYVGEQNGSAQVCTIPAGESASINVSLTLVPYASGQDSITLTTMSYALDTGSTPSNWVILPINITSSILSSGLLSPISTGRAISSASAICVRYTQLEAGYSTTGTSVVSGGNVAKIQQEAAAAGCD